MRRLSENYNLGVSTSQGTYYGLLPSREPWNRNSVSDDLSGTTYASFPAQADQKSALWDSLKGTHRPSVHSASKPIILIKGAYLSNFRSAPGTKGSDGRLPSERSLVSHDSLLR